MSDSLGDILKHKKLNEPPEVSIIKEYVQNKFEANCTVLMQDHQIIIGVKSAALAGTLRMQLHKLQELCQTEKRLLIRIS